MFRETEDEFYQVPPKEDENLILGLGYSTGVPGWVRPGKEEEVRVLNGGGRRRERKGDGTQIT